MEDLEMGVPGVDDIQPKPVIVMEFDSESAAYDFYNFYGGSMGFSIRKNNAAKSKSGEITSRTFVCSKEGHRKHDKRDYQTKNPRAETRTDCDALMAIKLIRQIGKYRVTDFVDIHNHPLVPSDLAHMLPSRRKISASQCVQIDLAHDSGIPLRSSYDLIGKEAGGRECLGYLKVDQKNYLRTRRQNMLAFGEAGSILKYFQDQALQNPSFFHAVQLDCEEQITNIFWADPKMIIDYAHFGDVVTFDTTFKLNRENRPFAVFIGFNNHREVIVFGAALMYNETADSFIWLFETFLEAMSNKHPQTIFTDQDAAMANAVSFVMPNVYHRLCTWHMMQNALKHMNSIFRGPGGVREVLGKFLYEYEEDEEFVMAWNAMLNEYNLYSNTWLQRIFDLREKWARPYVRWAWSAGMKSTQLSESFNSDLKDYLRSNHNWVQFFTHFERLLDEKRYKEREAEYALSYKLPKIKVSVKMLIEAGKVYTKTIFEEFQEEYVDALELCITGRLDHLQEPDCILYLIAADRLRQVKRDGDGNLSCSCRLFEMRGVLCSHAIKVLKDAMNIMEIPSQYILKRWTRVARAEVVQDYRGRDIEADPKLEKNTRYKSLCSLFNKIASRASELKDTYEVSIEQGTKLLQTVEGMLQIHSSCETVGMGESKENQGCADNENAIKPKGLKKRIVYDRRRRRIRSSVEKALAVTRQKRSSSEGVQVPPHMLQYLLSQCPQLPNSMPATWNAAAAACFAPSQ
ncbi:hypothetical protein RHSIM_Rhsim05G0213300 [Rhododendron simsii]|uniref:SWIM-type domain-containing protein n=1 Tax=Rhododendron simsii TaxID=118357 RepID=A0A834LMR5_RHOSS|nr:hypothetical protein RHSIM_Rhsim05G0213300 [Rhododendron simsii]